MQRSISLVLLAAAGCVAPGEGIAGQEPAPIVDSVDDIEITEDIGVFARVFGRFGAQSRYRGFTFYGEAGQQLELDMLALREQAGFLATDVPSRIFIYGPAEDTALEHFTEVVQDSGMVDAPAVGCRIPEDGHYLIVTTPQETVPEAQFELNVQCTNCGPPPAEPADLCRPGRLYVEGSILQSQEWRECDVILLEPARVPAGQTLTIGPDVNVKAHYYITDYHNLGWGETRLTIEGNLVMESTPEHPIEFKSNVDGKQWAGIDLLANGVVMHDFKLRDTYDGLRITGDNIRIENGFFRLNAVAIMVRAEADALTVAGSTFHDNRTGIINHYLSGTWTAGDSDRLLITGSEFRFTDQPMDLRLLTNSVIEDTSVHDNRNGITINNQVGFADAPETAVTIRNVSIYRNAFGIDLRGSGVIDDSHIHDNDTFGIRTTGGWHKIKNSQIWGNSQACDPGADWRAVVNCGAGIITEIESHTVIRNDVIRDNALYGIIIRGAGYEETARALNYDPAVLNSVVTHNGAGGILLNDAPITSIEFNKIQDNAGSQIALSYSTNGQNTTGRMYACDTPYTRQPDGRYLYVLGMCRLRNHRIERNNITGGGIFAVRNYGYPDRTSLTLSSAWTFGPNYFGGQDQMTVEAQLRAVVDRFTVEVMAEPEPQAGLVRRVE